MMPMRRPEHAPPYLAEHAAHWTANYEAGRQADAAHKFRWPDVEHEGTRQPLNKHLVRDLLALTANHCAYCDGFPMGEMSRETIDHFRPKGDPRFFHLAFAWDNLFPACDVCQSSKLERFDDALLKPDDGSYRFDRYFDFNVKTGALEPNRLASAEDQERARVSIEMFGLNSEVRCTSRKRLFMKEYNDAIGFVEGEADDLPYRFLAV
ncbi:MAG: hypothetical protein IPK82_02440 [Polyangiaceae bacterium]|nr:hypothetical protein [Polyangiaceae bacterium]